MTNLGDEMSRLSIDEKLKLHVKQDHEIPFLGTIDFKDDSIEFTNKKENVLETMIETKQTNYDIKMHAYKERVKNFDEDQPDYDARSDDTDDSDDSVNRFNKLSKAHLASHNIFEPAEYYRERDQSYGGYLINNLIFDAGFRLIDTDTKSFNQKKCCYCPISKMFSQYRSETYGVSDDGYFDNHICDNKAMTPSGLIAHLTSKRGCQYHTFTKEYLITLYSNFWNDHKPDHFAISKCKEDADMHTYEHNKQCINHKYVLFSSKLNSLLKRNEAMLNNKMSTDESHSPSSAKTQQSEDISTTNPQLKDTNHNKVSLKENAMNIKSSPLCTGTDNKSIKKSLGKKATPSSTIEVTLKEIPLVVTTPKVAKGTLGGHKVNEERKQRHQELNKIARERKQSKSPNSSNKSNNDRYSNNNHFHQQKQFQRHESHYNPNQKSHWNNDRPGHYSNSQIDNNYCHQNCRSDDRYLSYNNNQLSHYQNCERNHLRNTKQFDRYSMTSNNTYQNNLNVKDSTIYQIDTSNTSILADNREYYRQLKSNGTFDFIEVTKSNSTRDSLGRRFLFVPNIDKEISTTTKDNDTDCVSDITKSSSSSTKRKNGTKKSSHPPKQSSKKVRTSSPARDEVTFSLEQKANRKKTQKWITKALKNKCVKNNWVSHVIKEAIPCKFNLKDTGTSDLLKGCTIARVFPKMHINNLESLDHNSLKKIIEETEPENMVWHVTVPQRSNSTIAVTTEMIKTFVKQKEKGSNFTIVDYSEYSVSNHKLTMTNRSYMKKLSLSSSLEYKSVHYLVSSGQIQACVLDPQFVVSIVDTTTEQKFQGIISDIEVYFPTVTSVRQERVRWFLFVSFEGIYKRLNITTEQLRQYIIRNEKNEIQHSKILSIEESYCLSKNTNKFIKDPIRSEEVTSLYTTMYGSYHASDEDARSHSTDEEHCLVESNANVVEEGICVLCGTSSKNYRRNEDSICRHVKQPTNPLCKTVRNIKKKYRKEDNIHFLRCSICKLYSCMLCVNSLMHCMDTNKCKDSWYNNVTKMLSNKSLNKDFIGHCCEINLNITNEKKRKSHLLTHQTRAPPTSDNITIRAGLLHLPQLHVFIDSPMISYVDVHGLGKENTEENCTPGLIHAVVHEDIQLSPSFQDKSVCLFQKRKLVKTTDMQGKETNLKVVIHAYKIDTSIETKKLLHLPPSHSSIRGSKILIQPDNFDVWIILGMKSVNSIYAHLVNARWASNLDHIRWQDDELKESFLKNLLSHTKHNGLEVMRKGGSGGLPTYSNDNVLNLLRCNSAFPRKGKGVKIVKCDKFWRCFYLESPKQHNEVKVDRKFVKFDYYQPKIGGQLDISSSLITKYQDVISSMTVAKYNTALLIYDLSFVLGIVIQREAVINSLNQIQNQKDVFSTIRNRYKKKHRLIDLLATDNRFSVVAYPVCYHLDVFKDDTASLENKICMSFKSKNIHDIGRGGDGEGRFVFALLDWANNSTRQKTRQFVGSGGVLKKGERLTKAMWMQRFDCVWNKKKPT